MATINDLRIYEYKRFSNFSISLNSEITVISGANGTGKSSLLHLVSNSFQRPNLGHEITDEQKKILSDMPGILNLKIDKLSRGDKATNDPTHGIRGNVYTASGDDFGELSFRRHQTRKPGSARFSLKPQYAKTGSNTLPPAAVAYLGLSRLIPQGEVDDETALGGRFAGASALQEEIRKNYRRLTLMDIQVEGVERLAGLKQRLEFSTEKPGVDSNTISAGQDNVIVLLSALEHLAQFRKSQKTIPAIMLIDEFDATLHPDLQVRLLQLMQEYAKDYGIQFLLTTQSMDLIEYSLQSKGIQVAYLVSSGSSVVQIENPSARLVKMYLNNHTMDSVGLYESPKIPVFSEDDEARAVLEWLLEFCAQIEPNLSIPIRSLRYVNVHLGCDQLKALFKGDATRDVLGSTICVLDGDAGEPGGDAFKQYLITCLPGKDNPETVIFKHARWLLASNGTEFSNPEWLQRGYTHDAVHRIIDTLNEELKACDAEESKQKKREVNKRCFRRDQNLWKFIFASWCRQPRNAPAIRKFVYDFARIYSRAARISGATDIDWNAARASLGKKISQG